MASNSRCYLVIDGNYVKQEAPQADPLTSKYLLILPKQPVPTKNVGNHPFAKVESPPCASTGNPADPLLKDTNLVQPQYNSTGTSKVISLMKFLWCDDYGQCNHKNMTIYPSDIKRPIHCHASILSMVSTYIKDLIESSGSATSDQYSICLPDVSYETIRHFLERLYGFDDSECEKAFDMGEMDYLVLALGVKFHPITKSKPTQPPRDKNIRKVSKYEKPGNSYSETLTTLKEGDHNYSNLDEEPKTKIPAEQMEVQCDKCPQVLRRKKLTKKGTNYHGYRSIEFELRQHHKIHHDENLPFKCDLCDYRALTLHTIKVHKGNWHNSNKHLCTLGCGKVFTTIGSRGTHEKRWCSKSTVKEGLIQEEKADGRYRKELEKVKQRGLKMRHKMEILKTDPRSLLKCEFCGGVWSSQEELMTHIREVHNKTKVSQKYSKEYHKDYWEKKSKIQCDKCPFFGKCIEEHLLLHHNPDLPYGCQKCGYRAKTEFAITMHTVKVHSEKKFQCKLGCGKMFDNQWYAGFHEKRYCAHSKVKDELIKKDIENGKHQLYKERMKKTKSYKKNLVREKNMLKDPKEVTACHICGHLLSKGKGRLKLHISKQHPNESIE